MVALVVVEGWLQELPGIEEYYDSFGNHVPDELRQQLKALKMVLPVIAPQREYFH